VAEIGGKEKRSGEVLTGDRKVEEEGGLGRVFRRYGKGDPKKKGGRIRERKGFRRGGGGVSPRESPEKTSESEKEPFSREKEETS